jgi:hypothetical protein
MLDDVTQQNLFWRHQKPNSGMNPGSHNPQVDVVTDSPSAGKMLVHALLSCRLTVINFRS